MWDVKDSTWKNERTESNEGVFSSVTLYCTAGFGCLVIGNVLPGDSYHSCLSETGTLMACGDGCLKFSGEVCCWLRLVRSGIMSATYQGDRRVEVVEALPGYCWYFIYSEKQELRVRFKCTGQVKEYSVMKL